MELKACGTGHTPEDLHSRTREWPTPACLSLLSQVLTFPIAQTSRRVTTFLGSRAWLLEGVRTTIAA